MFCLDPLTPLFNATVDIVAEHPGIAIADLRSALKKRSGIDVSLQHVYRTVTRLTEAQILLKRKKQLFLNLLWLSHVELFAQNAKQRLLEGQDLQSLSALAPEKRLAFTARSLREMQAVWHHLLIQLNRIVPAAQRRQLHKYYAHAWWLLQENGGDASFYERIAAKGVECFWLIGNDTFLDRRAMERYKKIFAIALTDHSPFPKEGYNLNVFGEYVVECVFPKAIADHLVLLFRSVRSAKEWDAAVFENILDIPAPFTVTVTRSAAKADQLRAKIARLMPGSALRTPKGR